jgi:hypothetical protein
VLRTIRIERLLPGQVEVCRAMAALAKKVPIDQWCVVGGLMTEFVLAERGAAPVRATTDGDIVGDVFAHPKVLRSLAQALADLDFEPVASGWNAEFGTRFRHRESRTFFDLLAPDNSARRRDITTFPGRQALEAPGTDVAFMTATPMTVGFAATESVVVLVPNLSGAFYAKVSAYQRLADHDNRQKHLGDAVQLLAASIDSDFDDKSAAMTKRLRWMESALQPGGPGWEYVGRDQRVLVPERLRRALRSQNRTDGDSPA